MDWSMVSGIQNYHAIASVMVLAFHGDIDVCLLD